MEILGTRSTTASTPTGKLFGEKFNNPSGVNRCVGCVLSLKRALWFFPWVIQTCRRCPELAVFIVVPSFLVEVSVTPNDAPPMRRKGW